MDNTTFVGHSGTILNLWVNAEASARDHKKVKVENVVFSDAKAQTYRLEPIAFDVNVSFVVATSIRLSESSLLDNASWYNLKGIRFSEKPNAPGIYIHGGKKVVIK